ncbi:MAG TPA: phosphotransferase, partial [Roseiflexaceae bacterium]|nr:phosphotransferase [Roseiflexaceae bacterium]
PALARALSPALPEAAAGARVVRARATPLRYRPGRRCTLRLDLWLHDARGRPFARTLFGKVYHDLAKATSVYREMQLLAGSAPVRDGRLVVARPAAFLPELRLILQEPVRGTPLELLLEGMRDPATAGDRRGWEGVVASAGALAALHTAGLAVERERPIDAELRRFAKRAAQAQAIDPQVGGRLAALAGALPAWRARLLEWGEELTVVHGDCKHSQCMLTPAGVAVLDFDHVGMADPATDIGSYLATLRQIGIHQALRARGSPASADRARWLCALEERFLEAYCAASGYGPDFRLRAIWYEAAALMRKALRGFARSPRSPMPPAEVDEAWRILATLPPPEGFGEGLALPTTR